MSSERERLAKVETMLFNFLISYDSGGCCSPGPSTQEVEATCAGLARRAAALIQEQPTPEALRAWAEWFDDPNKSPALGVLVYAVTLTPGYLLRLIAGEMERPTDKE